MGAKVNKRRTSGAVKKPNALLFFGAASFFKLYFRLAYHHQVDKSAMKGVNPPYLVIANHSCWLDYIISSVSMFPVRMNYVGA